ESDVIPLQGEALDADTASLSRNNAAISAAWLLKSAVQAGCHDPNVFHLLATAYKRQGNSLECRNVLMQVNPRDVFSSLQLGVLALRETKGGFMSPLGQAEEEFARAWRWYTEAHASGNGSAHSPESAAAYAAAYNLLLVRLSQGKRAEALEGIDGLMSVTGD